MNQMGQNDPCACGSGKKYKQCCSEMDEHDSRHAGDQEFSKALSIHHFSDMSSFELDRFLGYKLNRRSRNVTTTLTSEPQFIMEGGKSKFAVISYEDFKADFRLEWVGL